jgi:hypothetical protein
VKPLALEDIVDRAKYVDLRPSYRAAVIDYKRRRRLAVGENITLLFEDRETLRFQVQEMVWVEGIALPDKIQHEIDTYNELMPADRELSATLFVEITEAAEIRPALDRLIGVDEHVSLIVGDEDEALEIKAQFDPKQMEEDRISAVQYIKFALDEEALRRFCDPDTLARVRVSHPNYQREAEIPPATRDSLIRSLRSEVEPLLPVDTDSKPAATESVVFETGAVRAVRPDRPLAPGHLIIEPIEAVESLLTVEDEVLTELMTAVKRAAEEIVRAHGACRVYTDLGGHGSRLRWHAFAPPS